MQIIKSLKNNIFIASEWTMIPHCHSSVHTSNIWCSIAILFCENVRSELKSSSVFLFFLFLSPPGFCHSYPPSWKDESSHHHPLLPLLLDSASLLTSFLTLLSHMSPSLPPSLWGADQFTASLQGVTTPHPYIPSVLTLNTFWWGVGRRGQEMIFQACEAIRTPETKAAVANVRRGWRGKTGEVNSAVCYDPIGHNVRMDFISISKRTDAAQGSP